MTIKTRIEKLRTKAGLDRCPCESQEARFAIAYLNDHGEPSEQPLLEYCPACGRCLTRLVEVEYVESPPPDWFKEKLGGLDEDSLMIRWREHINSGTSSQAAPAEQQEGAEALSNDDFF